MNERAGRILLSGMSKRLPRYIGCRTKEIGIKG